MIEAVIAVLLAWQVFTARPTPTADAPATTSSSAMADAPAARAASSPSPDPTATSAPDHTPSGRSEAPPKWAAGDPIGVLLTGTVRTRDGKPIEVSVGTMLGKQNLGASTAADGSYALLGLLPGECTIHLRGIDIVEASSSVTLTDDAVQHRDFVVDAAFAVKVLIVTPDGADGTKAMRKALSSYNNFFVAGQRDRFPDRLAPTDYGAVFVGDAKWSAEMNPKDGFAGTLHLAAVPAHVALLQRHMVLEQQVVQPGQQEVKFVVDVEALKKLVGSATVRVLDADTGEPLTKARVSLHTSNRSGGGQKVDAEGRAVLEGLSPGLLLCEIGAPDHETMHSTVRVDVGQIVDLGDVRLGKVSPLTGTLLDADGKPAAAEITWTELKWRTRPTEFISNRSTRPGADGTFSLWGTGHGTIAVIARDAQGNLARGVFDNPPTNPVVLRLGKLAQCVVTRPPDPTRAFTLTVFDGSRRAIAANTLTSSTPKFTVSLPAGDYTFEVHDEQDRLVQSGALTFGAMPCAVEIQ